jgi:hypothetical protein
MIKMCAAPLIVALWIAVGSVYAYQTTSGELSNAEQVLQSSTDGDALERAAIALAVSKKAAPIALLGQLLRDPSFLTRLDGADPSKAHLSGVLQALAEHPTPQVIELFGSLAGDPAFGAGDERKIMLMELLAREKPMTEQTAAVFERSNEEGYFAFNARLLTENASPRALTLFETMMVDKDFPLDGRVECLHVSVLPRRTELSILQAADKILSRATERGIVIGVIQSVFDFRQDWFGIESGISGPPAWQTASADSLRFAAALAAKVLQRRDLTASSLHNKVERERGTIVRLLGAP